MPNYADPFGRIGGTVGGAAGAGAGAAGGGFLGALGQVLQPLDYPRQAAWNAVRAGGRALSGEGTWDDALGALPGLGGAALAGGLIASGVGAPLGIAAGSLLGGAAQGLGRASGRSAYDAPEVSDVTGTEDMLPNMLVGAALDPLTYAGGIGGAVRGARIGEQAGQQFGAGLERAAAFRGPQYGGGMEKLESIRRAAMQGDEALAGHLAHWERNPDVLQQVLGEIEPGSQYLGHGVESVALSRPSGGVTTIGRGVPEVKLSPWQPPPTRPDLPEVLQAERSKAFYGDPLPSDMVGSSAADVNLRVEHTPFMDILQAPPSDPLGRLDWITSPERQQRVQMARDLADRLHQQGVSFWDAHARNIGMEPMPQGLHIGPRPTPRGPFITDAGAIEPMMEHPMTGESMGPVPRASDVGNQPPGMIQNWLLNLLGSDRAVQQELTQGLAQGARGGSTILPRFERPGYHINLTDPNAPAHLPGPAVPHSEDLISTPNLGIQSPQYVQRAVPETGQADALIAAMQREQFPSSGMSGSQNPSDIIEAALAESGGGVSPGFLKPGLNSGGVGPLDPEMLRALGVPPQSGEVGPLSDRSLQALGFEENLATQPNLQGTAPVGAFPERPPLSPSERAFWERLQNPELGGATTDFGQFLHPDQMGTPGGLKGKANLTPEEFDLIRRMELMKQMGNPQRGTDVAFHTQRGFTG